MPSKSLKKPSLKTQNFKLVLEYDGAHFFGFQRQVKHASVQGTLESALSKLFNQKLKIQAASGRTDTGVHAECQVVNFKIQTRYKATQIQKALNGILPPKIAVKTVRKVADDFHARYSARAKTYEYRIWNHPIRSPLQSDYTHHVKLPLDLKKMKQAAKFFKGRRDFRAVCSSNGSNKDQNTVRTLQVLEIKKSGALLRVRLRANGFLYRMVRNIVGALIEVGQGKLEPKQIPRILKTRDRRQAWGTAPAQGLHLVSVSY